MSFCLGNAIEDTKSVVCDIDNFLEYHRPRKTTIKDANTKSEQAENEMKDIQSNPVNCIVNLSSLFM